MVYSLNTIFTDHQRLRSYCPYQDTEQPRHHLDTSKTLLLVHLEGNLL